VVTSHEWYDSHFTPSFIRNTIPLILADLKTGLKKIATEIATVLYTFPLRKSKWIQKEFSKNPLKSRGY
jgi:hypothetical protein